VPSSIAIAAACRSVKAAFVVLEDLRARELATRESTRS
jgi:hypothetical protein